jgi:hypothetical protein
MDDDGNTLRFQVLSWWADDAEADSGTPANLTSTGVDPDGDSHKVAHVVGVSDATNVPPNPIGEALPILAASKWALPSPT